MIKSISDFRAAMRNGPYAWPGGYPLYFVMGDGGALSFDAAKENRRQILEALAPGNYHVGRYQWLPIAFEVNWEDAELYCDHTGKRIESAYAD